MAAMSSEPRPVGPGRPVPVETDPLRILLVAPPMLSVPPPTYAGTERVVAALGDELHRRGHHVALVASGDSQVPVRAHQDDRREPVVDGLLGSARRLPAAHHRGRVAGGRGVRHRPRAHGAAQLRVRPALRHAGDQHAARAPRHGGHAGAARGASERAAGRDQRQPAAVLPGPALGRDDLPRPAALGHAVRGPAGRLPGVRGPHHAREGHRGRDRPQPRERHPAQGRGQGPPRARSNGTSGRSSSPPSTTGRSSSWASSAPRSATRCTRVPWRP